MASGTGQTTGPYTITAGQTLSLNDPAVWSVCSEAVQLQNNTGYTIYAQSSGAGYNIQPFTSSTIPGAGGQTIVVVVSATANVQTGYLTAVWLLPGQSAPMPDGPMTIYPKTLTSLSVTPAVGGTGQPPFIQNITGFSGLDNIITITYSGAGNFTTYPYAWLTAAEASLNSSAYVGSVSSGTLTFYGLNLSSYFGSTINLNYGTVSAISTPVIATVLSQSLWPANPTYPYMNIVSAVGSH